MLKQYKNPILLAVPNSATLSAAETAINSALSSNAGYCLAGVVDTGSSSVYYVLDEDWAVPNPVHSVVLVEITSAPDTQLPSALSSNPGYNLVEIREFLGVPAWAFVLGSS